MVYRLWTKTSVNILPLSLEIEVKSWKSIPLDHGLDLFFSTSIGCSLTKNHEWSLSVLEHFYNLANLLIRRCRLGGLNDGRKFLPFNIKCTQKQVRRQSTKVGPGRPNMAVR